MTLDGTGYTNNLGLAAPAGTSLALKGAWTNAAASTITAVGATLSLGYTGASWSNAGTITATNSTVYLLGNFTQAALGNFTRTGGTVELYGTLAGGLSLDETTGSWILYTGILNGGTLSESGGSELVVEHGNVFGGVTVRGNLNLTQGSFFAGVGVDGGLTLNGQMFLGNEAGTLPGDITFGDSTNSAGTFGGTATVLFGANGSNRIGDFSGLSRAAGTLTIGPGITIHGINGLVGNVSTTASILNEIGSGPNPADPNQPLAFAVSVAGGVPDGEAVTLADASNNNAIVASGTSPAVRRRSPSRRARCRSARIT